MNKEYKIVFYDTFQNLDNWNFEHGFVRNNELQYYTNNNVDISNGLKIYGKKEIIKNEMYNSSSDDWKYNREYGYYTSSSINTKDKFEFKYGVLEVKAKIPTTSGSWPAIWLMGSEEYWPYSDEVDVMEMYLHGGISVILGNFMYYDGKKCIWNTKIVNLDHFTNKDKHWVNKFHVWKLDWQKDYMKIYLDDELINEIDISKIKDNNFKKKHYILLNLAIGSNGGIPLDEKFPLKYEIEYVKVYQK